MILKINEKEYNVHFGIQFIRELDKKNFLEEKGAKFGAGLELKATALYSYDTVALAEILYAGTCTERTRPAMNEIDRYIENYENLEALFDEVISELKKGNATRLKMENLAAGLKETQNQE